MKEIQTQRINTYLDALRAYPPEWEALITEKERYTFGELIEAAERVRKHPKEIEEKQGKRHIHWIQEPTIAHQLIQFLAYGDGNTVPVIAPTAAAIPARTSSSRGTASPAGSTSASSSPVR